MNKLFRFLLLLSLVQISGQTFAQFYSTGQDPASAKWKQIKTENFQVIFQKEFTKQAQQVATTLEFYYLKAGKSLDRQPKKISVILHNQLVTSNGYVAWAPKRMELYTTPSPDTYPDPWIEHLCVHEMRHVVQIDKLNQGITKILSIVFGQQATGLVAGQLPMWYLEGDAVCIETAFSNYGRGRLPSFNRGLKTHLLSDDERYSFDKMLFGSYKDYVPNYYELGYQVTSFARKEYGQDIWNKVENNVAKNSYTLLPTTWAFYRGLKKNYQISQKDLFKQTLNYLDNKWTIENADKHDPNFFQKYLINDYENYINPISLDKESVLALKKGKSHIPQFVLINSESEKVIYEPGYVIANDFSYANNLLVWAEYKPDIRWRNREFTSIKLLNIKTQKKHVLVSKSRYFSPDLSNDGSKIAVVKVDKSNNSYLVIIDSFIGGVERTIEPRNSYFLIRPQWSADGKSIFIIELTDSGKQVAEYKLANKSWSTLFKIEQGDIQRFIPFDNKIFFHTTLNGVDNVHVFDRSNQEMYQLSNSAFGISEFDINTNTNELVVNEYTSRGSRIATIPIERALWKKVDNRLAYKFELADVISKQESALTTALTDSLHDFKVKPYRKIFNQFNFHSWIPFYYDYENTSVGDVLQEPALLYEKLYPGLMLLSQNKLSTTETILSYAYKNDNHYVSSSLVLKGQYPIIRLSAKYGTQQNILTVNDVWIPETELGYSYDIDLYVPLNFSSGKYITGIRPWVSVEYYDNLFYNYQQDYYIKGLEYVQSDLLFYTYQHKAERDIYPKYGAFVNFSLLNTPFEDEIYGYMFNANAIIYLPGWKNSGFKIDAGYQYQNPLLYRFGSDFRFPRGINRKVADKMRKIYIDYSFPLAYPDWNLGSLLYLKRIRANIFYDYAYSTFRTVNEDRSAYVWPFQHSYSFGAELTFDYHLLRTIFPLNSGVRIGYAPSESSLVLDFIFGIDLFSF